ncbi:DUF898 family protein [Acinetobacter wanghuae]|uniref:DUF898 family protein n=1 Tax=Acinetobacter wanghuae TaxID=2662362 RepID=A0A5Q0NZU4_9GAMM|nr:YjgN family protein [Acinetobacter wanghuae]MQW93177.1 DUF898 family protein [Acinetobacter wanghuae]QGA10397.1 DUF898 family protein [Acinetobacter wanghuae]
MQNNEEFNPVRPSSFDSPFPPEIPTDDRYAVRLNKIQRFGFHGTGLEYFGIWIVNIVLMIVTLGLYSPWAKVRRLRYFYGNTELIQRRFDFTGIPSKILKGRLIALAIYFAISVISNLSVKWMLIGLLVVYLAVPWLLRATIRFNARNSKFSNARFYFSGSNKQAYWIFFKSMVLFLLTAGLIFPVLLLFYKRYCFDHLYAGQLKFRFTATWLDFMKAVYVPVLALMAFSVMLLMSVGMPKLGNVMYDPVALSGLVGLIALAYVVLLFVFWPWIQARIFMATWNNVVLSRSKFQTDCSQVTFVWIVISNWVLRIISLGLLTPWAAIRIYRYKVESLSLYLNNDPNTMMNQLQKDHSAIAEEISDIFDLDISL